MIVRRSRDALLLVTQPDHARLAADIVAAWRADGFRARAARDTILLATREHDNGWIEEDAAPRVDPTTGEPYDFVSAPIAVRQGIWPRGVARFADDRPAVAALIAQHALTVYSRYRLDPGWQPFFNRLTTARDALLARCDEEWSRDREAFGRDYRMLFLGDFLSLIFCNGWTDPFQAEGYGVRLHGPADDAAGPAKAGRHAERADAGSILSVLPDPFAGAQVRLRVRARRIPARRYASDDDLRQECARGDEVAVEGIAGSLARQV